MFHTSQCIMYETHVQLNEIMHNFILFMFVFKNIWFKKIRFHGYIFITVVQFGTSILG